MIERNDIITQVKQNVFLLDKKAEILLFGSRARQDTHKESDWDFIAFVENEVTEQLRQKLTALVFETELRTGEIISVQLFSKNQKSFFATSPFFKNVFREGIVI